MSKDIDDDRYYLLDGIPFEKCNDSNNGVTNSNMIGNDDDEEIDKRIEETKSGVTVTVKSKRGTGTNDRDSVTVKAHHDDLGDALNSVDRTDLIAYKQMKLAREGDPNDDRDE